MKYKTCVTGSLPSACISCLPPVPEESSIGESCHYDGRATPLRVRHCSESIPSWRPPRCRLEEPRAACRPRASSQSPNWPRTTHNCHRGVQRVCVCVYVIIGKAEFIKTLCCRNIRFASVVVCAAFLAARTRHYLFIVSLKYFKTS